MPRAANDVMQSIIFSAVLDGIAALKRASGGLPNQLLRDVQTIHPNVTFADLPKELQDQIAERLKEFVAAPVVTVMVTSIRSQQVLIMGKVGKVIKPPVGEVYVSIEAPKGELGYFVVSDGTTQPYRLRVRPPSFINLQALDKMVRGGLIADVVAVVGTIDIVLGEVDR